jgi:hypothetical protein
MPRSGNAYDNTRFSQRWLENGSFMRMKNLQIGYAIPAAKLTAITKGWISYARFYVGVYNLFTITKYKGYDPEVTRSKGFTNGENQLLNGIDNGGSPQPRMLQLGWQVNF